MNKTDVIKLRDQLLVLLADLAQQDALGEQAQKIVVLDQQTVGRLSRMDAIQGQAMARATAARRSGQTVRIHAALARISDGEFGYCLDCGEDLPLKRLELDPTAPLCVSCARG